MNRFSPYVAFAVSFEKSGFTIEAGAAFGSGAHPSTAMTLDWMNLLSPLLPAQPRVLDYGSGSGILSVAAVQGLGARLVACDNSAEAVAVTRRNLEAAGVSGEVARIERPGDPWIAARGPFDLILANLLAELLVPMLPAFARLLTGEGLLVLSGILRWQAESVEAACGAAGLLVVGQLDQEEWSSLCVRLA